MKSARSSLNRFVEKLKGNTFRDWVKYFAWIFLIGYALLSLFPFVWMVSISFKTQGKTFQWPPRLLPSQPTVQHYLKVWSVVPFGRWLLNSLLVTIVVVLGNALFASMAGFVFARLDFPLKEIIFYALLGSLMIPGQITLIPKFITMKWLGWVDTYPGIFVPKLVTVFSIFLMRQFFQSIPESLVDTARIDGCSYYRVFWNIMLPLAKPALAAVAIYQFMGAWNGFMWPLIIAQTPEMFTLPVGLAYFQNQYYTFWGKQMAAATIMSIPTVLIFIMFQKQFTEGIHFSGIKG